MKRQALIVIASAFVLGAPSDEGTSKVWYEGSGSCGGVPPDTTLPDPGPEWDPLSKYHQYEPPRDCRRLHSVRGWSHGQNKQIFPRS